MISKIEITSELEVLTGMHIGGTNEFAAIGAIDSPVVRDVISRLPMIPGSTLKGKMRNSYVASVQRKLYAGRS